MDDEQRLNHRLINETLYFIPNLDQMITQLEEEPQVVINSREEVLRDTRETLLLIQRDGIDSTTLS